MTASSRDFVTIDHFINNSFLNKEGFLKSSRFISEWTPNPSSKVSLIIPDFDVLVENMVGVTIPSISLSPNEAPFRINPGRRSVGNINMFFLESEDLNIKRAIHQWIDLSVSYKDDENNYQRNYIDDISVTLKIKPVKNDGSTLYYDQFVDVFPVRVTELTYDIANEDEMPRISAAFAYRYHTIEG